jgi:hypothetical protein
MMNKIEIDKEKRERIIDKAGHLADEDGVKYWACAPATFGAICDAFRSEDIELFSPEVQEALIQGMMGLHGGIAMTGVGTCGAVTAATFLISYVVGVPPEKLKKDGNLNYAASVPAVEYVIDRFEEDYGAIDCLRVRYNRVDFRPASKGKMRHGRGKVQGGARPDTARERCALGFGGHL